MLLLERFMQGGGWLEIAALSVFGFFLSYKMQFPDYSAKWRKISWAVFSLVFFVQLALGLLGFEHFLMTGDLHFPIPGIILGGALYRWELGFMPILFLSTILLSGPAWCSQLCYFGAVDYLASGYRKKRPSVLKRIGMVKSLGLAIFILSALVLRMSGMAVEVVAYIAGAFGVGGLLIILFLSSRKGNMIHCIYYCPIGTLVNVLKYLNPFRMKIHADCNRCMKCTTACRYGALERKHIEKNKPGFSCTYCGDCISSCHSHSIQYRLFGFSSKLSRSIFLVVTISIYICFLAVARI